MAPAPRTGQAKRPGGRGSASGRGRQATGRRHGRRGFVGGTFPRLRSVRLRDGRARYDRIDVSNCKCAVGAVGAESWVEAIEGAAGSSATASARSAAVPRDGLIESCEVVVHLVDEA